MVEAFSQLRSKQDENAVCRLVVKGECLGLVFEWLSVRLGEWESLVFNLFLPKMWLLSD
jgi:hypothetical protein